MLSILGTLTLKLRNAILPPWFRLPTRERLDDMIYLNNAATTWPKPEVVYKTVDEYFRNMDSPMRSAVGDLVQKDPMMVSRKIIADFFGIADPLRLVLTPGCTYALNLAILGIDWKPGDVAIMSGLEHHAVSRPIRKAKDEHGITFEVAPYEPGNPIDLDFIEKRLKNGRVRLVVCSMASNVSGDILPIKPVIDLAHRYDALCLVDAAQSAGLLDINVEQLGVDMLAFAGHKGLFGPPGIGGLYVASHVDLRTLAEGGTGGDSGKHGLSHQLPNSYEVGTHNLPAIVGLASGIKWLEDTGLDTIRGHERKLVGQFISGLQQLPCVTVYGTGDLDARTGVVSITMEGISPKDLSKWLAAEHNISTRAGYHCAPLSHETIGTLPGDGTTRFGFGYFNTPEEVATVLDCMAQVPRAVCA